MLAPTRFAAAARRTLAGDASARRYERLTRPGTRDSAILMDAPPGGGEDTRAFARIARHLGALGLSAPRILAADHDAGWLLVEDLGDELFARRLDRRPEEETRLYAAAVDVLVALHAHPPPPAMPCRSPCDMAGLIAPVFEDYAAGILGTAATPDAGPLTDALAAALCEHAAAAPVLALRDYHAENLLWLPQRPGPAAVGLLDFQDAFAGHPAYDLVSLLTDARREVSASLARAMQRRYAAATGRAPDRFAAAAAATAVQRNLRILGVFARLARRRGKPGYIDLLPRVWGYLQRDLGHPALAEVAQHVARALPAPTPEALNRLRAPCPTCPGP